MKTSAKKQSRDQLIEQYQEYVQFVAGKLVKALGLPVEHFDEFVAAGYLGLVEAADRFDFNSGVEFKHFAYLRIRGAIIDGIRNCSELSGRAYRFSKALQAAQELKEEEYERRLNASHTTSKDLPEEKLAKVLDYAAKGALAFRLSISDVPQEVHAVQAEDSTPEEAFQGKEDQEIFRRIVATLPEKERIIIEGYYFEGKSFRQIAEENDGMTKSWVSRLHTRALETIRSRYSEETS